MPYGPIPREFGVSANINFTLFELDGVKINATASCVTGDVVIMPDDGSSANATNLFSAVAIGHRIVLTNEETSAARIVIKISDLSSTQGWLDETILVETYGHPDSQYGQAADTLVSTSIDTLTSQLVFALTDGSSDDDAYVGAMAVITDMATNTQKAVGIIVDYIGSTKSITLGADPGIFTMAAGDLIDIIAIPKQLPNALPSLGDGLPTVDDNNLIAGIQGTLGTFDDLENISKADVSSVLTSANMVTTDDLPTNFGSLSITTGGGVVPASGVLSTAAYVSAAKRALIYNWSALPDFSADRSTINALRFLRNKWKIEGSTLSVYKEDDTTIAWDADLSTVASANSIVDLDPS